MIIELALKNFSLALFILALIISTIQWGRHQKIPAAEIFYRWMALLPLGLAGLYGFVMHAFFPDISAAAIGWTNSPFQYEVAMANLGFGLIAILSYKASYGFRLATVIANTCWLWGDASGHIYQMITQHNFASGNAGSWFWMDIILPLVMIICISKIKPQY
jgi:hypothetical protein